MLDAVTVSWVSTANLLVMAMVILTLWRRDRDAALSDWTLGLTLGALGEGLGAARGSVPELLSVAGSGTLLLCMNIYLYVGLCRLFNSQPKRGIWLLPILACPLHLYFIYAAPLPQAGTIINAALRFAICGMILLPMVYIQKETRPPSRSFGLLLVSLCMMAMFMLLQGISALWEIDAAPVLRSGVSALTSVISAASLLAMIVGLLMIYIEQLLQRLERAANTDVLTGLRNRRRFNEMAGNAVRRSSCGKQKLWLLMIDIDHFKAVNDRYGHDVGDLVLQRVSQILHDTLRGDDIIARYGGEEFCVLLPNTDEAAACGAAQRLLKAVAGLRIGPANNHRVTVSIGAAALEANDAGLDSLLKRADLALYEAKCTGRNRATGFTPTMA